jgi:two-component system, cell cycle sensor histidine kinase and response regulator CckA
MTEPLRVLIIEDKLRDAKRMAHELERAGFAPHWQRVDTESDFLAQLTSIPDVILTDGFIPGFDATRVLDIMKEHGLDTPVIVVTGSLSDERAVTFMKHGAADYLLKDRLARLGQAVTQALGKQRLSAEARRIEEERNRFFNLSGDMLCVAGFDGYFKLLNPAWVTTLGWSIDELLWRPQLEFVHPADLAATISKVARFVEGEDSLSFENRYRCKDGSYRWLSWRWIPDRARQLIYATARDMTQAKQVEQELRERDERFRLVAMATNDAVWDWDLSTRRVWWNESTHKLFRYQPGEVGEDCSWWEERLHPDDRAAAVASLETAIRSRDDVWSAEYRFRRGDGSYAAVLDRGYISRDDQGTAVRILGAMVDITDRKRAEQRFRNMVESAPDALVIVDSQGTIVLVNNQTEQQFGYRREDMLGRSVEMLLPERFRDKHVIHRRHFTDSPGVRRMGAGFDLHGRRKDGSEFPVEISLSQLESEDGMLIVSAIRDITENRHLEMQLRQSQKMEAIGKLAGGVAHDFNNLLTIINGYSEVMLTHLAPGDPNRQMVQEIVAAGGRAAGLTRQLLSFSRKQVWAPRVLDLADAIRDTEKWLRRLIGEDVKLQIAIAAPVWPVKMDHGQMDQVILNLVVNARDAMPRGGSLTIQVRNHLMGQVGDTANAVVPAGRYVLVSVTDTGAGMDAATRAHIFEPFFTTKGERGTGIGLATVYGIVTQAGGYIDVESVPGRGTEFKLYFPATSDRAAGKSFQGVLVMPRGTETILLVEDEEAVRSLSRHVLQSCGYKLLEAANGREAMQVGERIREPIHLIVTDVVMPEMGGRELVDQFLVHHPETRVLYVSGYTEDVVIRHGVMHANVAFMHKPFTTSALAQKVREVLDEEPAS